MNLIKLEDIPSYTYKDYLNWEGRWELIEGIAYAMSPAPSIEHQEISANITHELKNALKNCNECKVLLPVDWKISNDIVVQPDNLVICKNIKGKVLETSPVIIFEILSDSTESKDRNIKYRLYEANGVKYYIIVNYKKKIAEVYELINNVYEKISEISKGSLDFDIGECKITFDFTNIWIS